MAVHVSVLTGLLSFSLAAPPASETPLPDPPPIQRPKPREVKRTINPAPGTEPQPAPTPAPVEPAPAPVPPAGPEPPPPSPAPDGTATGPTPAPVADPAATPAPAAADPIPPHEQAPPPAIGDPTAAAPPPALGPEAPPPSDAYHGPPPGPRPGPPGSGMIIGGFALAGPGLFVGLAGLGAAALTTTSGNPSVPILLGTGAAMFAGGGVLLGFGFRRNILEGRWSKATGVRIPRSGHGLITGGAVAAAAGGAMIGWQADVVRRSPREPTCDPVDETQCEDPRSGGVVGIGVGVMALGGAATLLALGIKRKRRYDSWLGALPPVQPSVAVLPGGGGLSLSGRF